YSRSAASPRARTAARISSVARSIAGSCATSNARSSPSAASKPASAVESRLTCTHRLPERLDQRCDLFALELERGRIHDEPAGDWKDVLDRAQSIGAQRFPGIDEVDDGIGEADERGELHRSV